MRSLAFFFIYMCIITSCDNNQIIEKKNVTNNESPSRGTSFQFCIDNFFFDGSYQENEMNTSKKMIQAQSKMEWKYAAENKIPAWCYLDTLNTFAVLYNGYVLSELEQIDNYLLIDALNKKLASAQATQADFESCDSLFLFERNANGNFYNLGYHSFWIPQNVETTIFKTFTVDVNTHLVSVNSVNPGNGYFIKSINYKE
jgi:hypothetical protein